MGAAKGAVTAEGAVAVGGGVIVEEDQEVRQCLPSAAELSLVDLPGHEQYRRCDAGKAHPAPHLADDVPGGVAHVERLHRTLVVLHHQPLRPHPASAASLRLVSHHHPKLLLTLQECLKETADPREGEEPLPNPQFREADSHMALECLEVSLPA